MIVQEQDAGLVLFRQTDHALLSGAFAHAWGNDELPGFTKREHVLVAAARHDDGWADWELAPTLGPDGRPVDFIRVPVSEHVVLYRRGIDLVEEEDAYAGLVASLHGERLYTRPFEPGMDPRIERLEGGKLELARRYVAYERERQQRLLGALAAGESAGAEDIRKDAEEAWRLLQVWDRLSLLVCMRPLREGTQRTLPPVASERGDVLIEARATGEGELLLDPYPFAAEPAEFVIAALRTEAKVWESETAFRHSYRLADPTIVAFRCRRG